MKTDARVRYTRKVIRENFLALLEEKPVSKITVKELCDRCEINRATFYKHYKDPFDLLESIEGEMIESVRHITRNSDFSDLPSVLVPILKNAKENKSLFKIIASENGDENFPSRIYAVCYEEVFPRLEKKADRKSVV